MNWDGRWKSGATKLGAGSGLCVWSEQAEEPTKEWNRRTNIASFLFSASILPHGYKGDILCDSHSLSLLPLVTEVILCFGSWLPAATAMEFTLFFPLTVLVERTSAAWENNKYHPASKNLYKTNFEKSIQERLKWLGLTCMFASATYCKTNLKCISEGKQNWLCSENAYTASLRGWLDSTKVLPWSEILVKSIIQKTVLHLTQVFWCEIFPAFFDQPYWGLSVVISDASSGLVRLWREL